MLAAGAGTRICRVVVGLPRALGFDRAGETPCAPRGPLRPPCSRTHHGDISRCAAGRSLSRPDPDEGPWTDVGKGPHRRADGPMGRRSPEEPEGSKRRTGRQAAAGTSWKALSGRG